MELQNRELNHSFALAVLHPQEELQGLNICAPFCPIPIYRLKAYFSGVIALGDGVFGKYLSQEGTPLMNGICVL